MFTGIVKGMGRVIERRGSVLVVEAPFDGFSPGDSVAVNGTCLTVTAKRSGATRHRPARLSFDVSPETFDRTSLGALKVGEKVNLEPPLTPSSPLGGHWVTGHVDAVARILEKKRLPDGFLRIRFSLPKSLARFVAMKGSVAIDGVSLTVTGLGPSHLESVLVPHTLQETTLGTKRPGDAVNLEVDLLARYMERILSVGKARKK